MTERRWRPGPARDAPTAPNCGTERNTPRRPLVSSSQVSWWSVHEHVLPYLERAGDWPMLGTPAWVGLADDDPRKWAALLDGARHWALRVETCQEAEYQAAQD